MFLLLPSRGLNSLLNFKLQSNLFSNLTGTLKTFQWHTNVLGVSLKKYDHLDIGSYCS
jgi:hypothetical protein